MNVHRTRFHTTRPKPGNDCVIEIIDQGAVPHRFAIERIGSMEKKAAGYIMYLATSEASRNRYLPGSPRRPSPQSRGRRQREGKGRSSRFCPNAHRADADAVRPARS